MTLFKKIFSRQTGYNLCIAWNIFMFAGLLVESFKEPDPMLASHYKIICENSLDRCAIPLEVMALFFGVPTFIALILPDKHRKGKWFFILLPIIYFLLMALEGIFLIPAI